MLFQTYRLRIIGGCGQGQCIAIHPNHLPLLVGRGQSNHTRLRDPYMSRKHFLIDFQAGSFRISDQNSQTGTQVNQQRIETAALTTGDEILAGATIFRFERSLIRPLFRLASLSFGIVSQPTSKSGLRRPQNVDIACRETIEPMDFE